MIYIDPSSGFSIMLHNWIKYNLPPYYAFNLGLNNTPICTNYCFCACDSIIFYHVHFSFPKKHLKFQYEISLIPVNFLYPIYWSQHLTFISFYFCSILVIMIASFSIICIIRVQLYCTRIHLLYMLFKYREQKYNNIMYTKNLQNLFLLIFHLFNAYEKSITILYKTLCTCV